MSVTKRDIYHDIFHFPRLFTNYLTTTSLDTFIGPERSDIDWIIKHRLYNKGYLEQVKDDYSVDEYKITTSTTLPVYIYVVSGFLSTTKIVEEPDVSTNQFMLYPGYERNYILMKDVITQHLGSIFTVFDKDYKIEKQFKELDLWSLKNNIPVEKNKSIPEDTLKELYGTFIQSSMIEELIYMVSDIFTNLEIKAFDLRLPIKSKNKPYIKSIHQMTLIDLIVFASIYRYLSSTMELDRSNDDHVAVLLHHMIKTDSILQERASYNDDVDYSNVVKLVKFINDLVDEKVSATVKICMVEDYVYELNKQED